jgi:glycosyltransferase involved in cell wall biosynthesis
MHIGIDAHAIGARQGGNETYIKNLVTALAAIDSTSRYTLYFSKASAAREWTGRFENFAVRLLPPPTPIVRVPVALSFELFRRPVDVLHVQYTAPPLCRVPLVTTIHDLAFEHLPETFTRRGRAQLRLTVRHTARCSQRIATVSEFSRQDIISTYGIDPARIAVTPNGVEDIFTPHPADVDESERIRERFGIKGEFILAVGSLQPRKNLIRLIRAYKRLRAEIGDSAPQLVLVGRRLWLYDEIFHELTRQDLAEAVIFTDYVSEELLPALYRSARIFVYPSLFEGFGLPPLEAMACGTPVVASSTSSLPEVIGDAGLLVDPYDENLLANGMMRLLRDEDLRRQLITKGIRRAASFTWRAAAERTLALYHETLEDARNSHR